MRLSLRLAILVSTACAAAFLATPNLALARGAKFYEKGTLVQMNSAECGTDAKSAEGIGGMLGVNDSAHMKTKQMLCPEYTLRTDRTEYRIRPKEDKHPFILPIGQDAQFRIIKDHMKILVPELDNHEREYIVVSVTPLTEAKNSADAAAKASVSASAH